MIQRGTTLRKNEGNMHPEHKLQSELVKNLVKIS